MDKNDKNKQFKAIEAIDNTLQEPKYIEDTLQQLETLITECFKPIDDGRIKQVHENFLKKEIAINQQFDILNQQLEDNEKIIDNTINERIHKIKVQLKTLNNYKKFKDKVDKNRDKYASDEDKTWFEKDTMEDKKVKLSEQLLYPKDLSSHSKNNDNAGDNTMPDSSFGDIDKQFKQQNPNVTTQGNNSSIPNKQNNNLAPENIEFGIGLDLKALNQAHQQKAQKQEQEQKKRKQEQEEKKRKQAKNKLNGKKKKSKVKNKSQDKGQSKNASRIKSREPAPNNKSENKVIDLKSIEVFINELKNLDSVYKDIDKSGEFLKKQYDELAQYYHKKDFVTQKDIDYSNKLANKIHFVSNNIQSLKDNFDKALSKIDGILPELNVEDISDSEINSYRINGEEATRDNIKRLSLPLKEHKDKIEKFQAYAESASGFLLDAKTELKKFANNDAQSVSVNYQKKGHVALKVKIYSEEYIPQKSSQDIDYQKNNKNIYITKDQLGDDPNALINKIPKQCIVYLEMFNDQIINKGIKKKLTVFANTPETRLTAIAAIKAAGLKVDNFEFIKFDNEAKKFVPYNNIEKKDLKAEAVYMSTHNAGSPKLPKNSFDDKLEGKTYQDFYQQIKAHVNKQTFESADGNNKQPQLNIHKNLNSSFKQERLKSKGETAFGSQLLKTASDTLSNVAQKGNEAITETDEQWEYSQNCVNLTK